MFMCNRGHTHKQAFNAVTGNCRFCKAADTRRFNRLQTKVLMPTMTPRIMTAGTVLSNLAHNLSQLEGGKLSADWTRRLDKARREWDAALRDAQPTLSTPRSKK
jgi:hypothetical protein